MARLVCALGLAATLLPAQTAVAEVRADVLAGPQADVAAEVRNADSASPSFASSFVRTSGTEFTLAGAPFRFVGANMYNAAGDPAIYECGPWMANPDVELDEWFRRARSEFGGQVIRFWAYQSYTKGGTDWRALDRVFRLAGTHGLKVVPVLENQWTECSEGGYKQDSWYAGGYEQPYGAYPLSYKEYVRRVVTRYKDEPAIAAWMLMNEAESKSAAGQANPEALYRFATEMSGLVKSIDRNHLVTLGVMGSGQPGVDGPNFERLHRIPSIDFAEYHDYGKNDFAMPGAEQGASANAAGAPAYNTLAHAIYDSGRLGKPLLVGESGMTTCGPLPGWQPETHESRAQKFDAKMGAFFARGGAGYLVWTWNPRGACDHDFSTGDPLNAVLLKHANGLASFGRSWVGDAAY